MMTNKRGSIVSQIDPFEKLKPMEDFCRTSGIFFDDGDRIKQQIKASETMYKEYRHTMQRGFRDQILKESNEEKNLKKLLSQECKYEAPGANMADLADHGESCYHIRPDRHLLER